MKILSKKSLSHSIPLLLSLFIGSSAIADDTEVYVGSSALKSKIRPNITFIIDTSGSMGNTVPVTTVTSPSGTDPAFIPTNVYTGGTNCPGDGSKVYWAKRGDATPKCDSKQYIDFSAFKCNSAASAISGNASTSGYYVDRFYRYGKKAEKWKAPKDTQHSQLMECEDDWGIHGNNTGDTKVYPRDGNNNRPWTSDASHNDLIDPLNVGSLYTFYSANYIAWYNKSQGSATTTDVEKIVIVKDVFASLMTSISGVNIAIMRFDSGYNANGGYTGADGGYFIRPMTELTTTTATLNIAAVNATTDRGGTPLAESLYESYLFYKGGKVDYGDSSNPEKNHAGVFTDSVYDSPIEDFCQKNFVILLTDGEPTSDTGADNKIEALANFKDETGAATCSGNCLDELAEYMYKRDCRSNLSDTQNVITYTIGFDTNQVLLSDTARKGGGEYYTANDYAGLTTAFTAILTDILAINTTFVAPAVSVNAFNRFTHRDELYYALFRPVQGPAWNGNVKKFRLTNGVIMDNSATPAPAVDPNTGFFKSTATSYWTSGTDAPDGAEVEKGGAAAELTLPRKMYTNTGTTNVLSDDTNKLHENNSAVTKTMLGNAAMSDADRTNVMQWARGVDINDIDDDQDSTDARRVISDPLHSQPLLLTYGGTEKAPDMTLFMSTNGGNLHAFNSYYGSELFSFMPQDLLPNLQVLLTNSNSVTHPYGLDGPLTYWFNDANNNGLLLDASKTIETGEHIYIYQGMRRGGKNYYALDVSDRANPKLLWTIKGGSGDFSELAQTWSAATYAKLKINGTDTDVLIFGGGYDATQDNNELAQDDTEGRAIFIVNAKTGAKIWQAGPAGSGDSSGADPSLVLSEMTNSIPSDVTVFDTDGDGYDDRIYVGDMRAQLWRIDLNMKNKGAATLATTMENNSAGEDIFVAAGGVIAKLGGSTAKDNRRFYYAPDVSRSLAGNYYNIAIGSGYRAHPLDLDIHDSFYVIRDGYSFDQIRKRINDGHYITPTGTLGSDGKLFDATKNVIGQGTAAEAATAQIELYKSQGWYIKLDDRTDTDTFIGEKSLSTSTTFAGVLLFTTYTPTASNNTSSCSPSQGQARLYYVNINDATSRVKDGKRIDREYQLIRGGIPPKVTIILTKGGDTIVTVGSEVVSTSGGGDDDDDCLVDCGSSRKANKTYWRQN